MNPSFDRQFQSLTGFSPMRWQTRLFKRFVEEDIPEACDIPTGLGKTSVLVIWLLALARQAKGERTRLPRRLIYIVNRRTVVDQATRTVERMRHRLFEPDKPDWQEHADTLKGIASSLQRLCAFEGSPLGVSTLRGELADNEEWKTDPARPAIVIGTIDMVGSKLLFSGYGDRRYRRAHHAGLIGYDALIVHDEAHLTPAFNDLLHAVAQEQWHEAERGDQSDLIERRIRVVELSATRRGTDGCPFTLEREDEEDRLVQERMTASKRLYLHPVPTDSIAEKIVELGRAHEESCSKVLIYVRTPGQAQQIASALTKALGRASDERVGLLTGAIRGHERDALVASHPVYCVFLDPELSVEKSAYLVSTSAGEVGIDLDADNLICDPTTLDALIQRLGRVNRRGGEGRTARVDVVGSVENKEKPSEFERAVAATQALLEDCVTNSANDCIDVSPQDLRELLASASPEAVQTAFSPQRVAPPLTDVLLDNWAMTSIDTIPGRQEVAAYLHGLTIDPPDTFVVWRSEVLLFSELVSAHDGESEEAAKKAHALFEETLSDWFSACRIQTRERLRESTEGVRAKLGAILRAHRRDDADADFPVVLLDGRGRAEWSTLATTVRKPDGSTSDLLRYRTVVLPVQAGGLDSYGMLTVEIDLRKGPLPVEALDVAEADGQRARALLRQVGTAYWLQDLGPLQAKSGWSSDQSQDSKDNGIDRQEFRSPQDAAVAFARERDLVVGRLITLEQSGEGEDGEGRARYLLLMIPPKVSAIDDPERAPFEQSLDDHTRLIGEHADRIANGLELSNELRSAMICAARWHDKGKDRPVWQRFARNDNGAKALAKSTRYLHGRALGGYRHEFGSLLEAMTDKGVRNQAERDLLLHLIAAHHGWGRPQFEPRAFDHQGPVDLSTGNRCPPTCSENEAAAIEVVQRFGRLQQRFGRWGLAWLESILRCADIAASQPAPAPQHATPDPDLHERRGVRK